MANNKVQLADGTTLIDLTSDTVTPQTMLAGTTAHAASGEQITGVVELANAGDAIPLANSSSGAIGSSTDYAREDHRHPFSDQEFVFRKVLENGTDINTVKDPGVYLINGNNTYQNSPVSWGTLVVLNASVSKIVLLQIIYLDTFFLFRYYDKAWLTWRTVTSSSLYGSCSSAADATVKEVTINSVKELYGGLCIKVFFLHGHTGESVPMLNLNNFGAKNIRYNSGYNAFKYEWGDRSILDLIYISDLDVWVIINGNRATTTSYGKTKLSNAISDAENVAATPSAVKEAYDLAATKADPSDIPSPADSTPLTNIFNGAIGTSEAYARQDHQHPTNNINGICRRSDALPTNTNLNDLTTLGVYALLGGRTYQNSPSTYGVLEVVEGVPGGVTSQRFQRLTTDKAIFIRYYSSSASSHWLSWYKYTGTVVS